MKKVMLSFMLAIILGLSLVSAASSVNFNIDGKSYLLTLKSAYYDRADLTLNGGFATLPHVQKPTNNTGYEPQYVFPSANDLSLILMDSIEPPRTGAASYSDMMIGVDKIFEVNLSDYGPLSKMNIDGQDLNIKIESVSLPRSAITLSVNGAQFQELSPQTKPFDLLKYQPVNGLRFVLRDLKLQDPGTNKVSVSLIMFFEENLTLPANCTLTGNCQNITPINKSDAGSIILNCSKDSDCPSAAAAELAKCKDNKSCSNYAYNICVNPKTDSSYCKITSSETCTPCDFGCKEGSCLNAPAKQENKGINWWLMGAGILVIGAIILYFINRRRKYDYDF